MEFAIRDAYAGPFDDLIGKTVTVAINGYAAGDCVIKSVASDGTATFEIDRDTPAARMLAVGMLREGSVSIGSVAHRVGDEWHIRETTRLDFPIAPVRPAEPSGS